MYPTLIEQVTKSARVCVYMCVCVVSTTNIHTHTKKKGKTESVERQTNRNNSHLRLASWREAPKSSPATSPFNRVKVVPSSPSSAPSFPESSPCLLALPADLPAGSRARARGTHERTHGGGGGDGGGVGSASGARAHSRTEPATTRLYSACFGPPSNSLFSTETRRLATQSVGSCFFFFFFNCPYKNPHPRIRGVGKYCTQVQIVV